MLEFAIEAFKGFPRDAVPLPVKGVTNFTYR
jgi:hypothetical protein